MSEVETPKTPTAEGALPKDPEKVTIPQPIVITPEELKRGRAMLELGFVAWWALRKWLWRNTAAALWIFALWRVVGTPPIPWFLQTKDALALGVFFILFITEFQLTQLIWFTFYAASLPLWLPVFGVVQYVRRRMRQVSFGRSRFKTRIFRLCTALLLLSLFFWWPLPSPQVALGIGTLAFIPGAYLLRRTFRFALSPGRSLLDIRTAVDGAAEALRKADPASSPNTSPQTAAQVEGWKTRLLGLYDSHFLGGIEKGLLRIVAILYFCALLLACLLYVGFLGALWLRAFTPSQQALAAAVGRTAIPDLATMSFICSLGVLGEWHLQTAGLDTPARVIVVLLNIARLATSFILIAAFFGSYSADIARVEAEIRKERPAP